MASALSALANATVTFQVAGTGVITDPTTGNVMPVVETVSGSFFLKGGRQRSLSYPGVEVVRTQYEGYAVNPAALDTRIAEGTTATIVFGYEEPVVCEVLEVRLPYSNKGTLGSVLSSVLGERIVLITTEQR